MTLSNKSPSTQAFRLMFYRRALHPELFHIQERRAFQQSSYEMESWIMPGGHVLRFQTAGQCVTELVTDQDSPMPERGLIHTLPCIGEKEFEETVGELINYVTTAQTEQLSDNLYLATYQELREFALESESLMHEWTDAEGITNLSVLDIQRYRRELHAQSYHLVGSGGFVLRTQTIFEITKH